MKDNIEIPRYIAQLAYDMLTKEVWITNDMRWQTVEESLKQAMKQYRKGNQLLEDGVQDDKQDD